MIEAKKLFTYNYNTKSDIGLAGFIDKNGDCLLLYGRREILSLKELERKKDENTLRYDVYDRFSWEDDKLIKNARFNHIYVGTGDLDGIAIIDMTDKQGKTTMTSYGRHEIYTNYNRDKEIVGVYTIEHKVNGNTIIYALTDGEYSTKTIFRNPYEDVLYSLPYASLKTPYGNCSADLLLIQNGIDFDIAQQESPNASYKTFTQKEGPREFYIQEWKSILDENIWYYKIDHMVVQKDFNNEIVDGHGRSIYHKLIPFLRKIKLLKPLDE